MPRPSPSIQEARPDPAASTQAITCNADQRQACAESLVPASNGSRPMRSHGGSPTKQAAHGGRGLTRGNNKKSSQTIVKNNNNNNDSHVDENSSYSPDKELGLDAPRSPSTPAVPHLSDSRSVQVDQRQQQLQEHQTQRNFFQNMFSPKSVRGDNQDSDDLLSPLPLPSAENRTWRRGSNSSIDFPPTANYRRRGSYRGGSLARMADVLDEDSGDAVSLMTYMRGINQALKRARKSVRRFLTAVFVTQPERPKLVCEDEVLEQVSWVCRDYIVAKLMTKDLMSRKTGIAASNWPPSYHVIVAGQMLESLYPRVYSNLCRKLSLTMSSPKVVRNTLALFFDVLFERDITWAKIVSMLAVASMYAEECASQGHPDYITEVVAVVQDFAAGHLVPWLVQQGGWEGFPLPESDQRNSLSIFRILLVIAGATTLVFFRYYFQVLRPELPKEE